MGKITRILFRGIGILLVTYGAVSLYSQQTQSILLRNDFLIIRTRGIVYLGSGITEDDAKIFAINDAKRNALEQAGTYIESHTTVLNYQLVKDEIITFTGGILNVKVLQEKRKLINNMFAFEVEIEATIDTKLLNQSIKEIRGDYGLREQLKALSERNKHLEARIAKIYDSGGAAPKQEVKGIVNSLTAFDLFNTGHNYYYSEKYVMAINYLDRAIRLDPRSPEAYYYRGLANYGLGNHNSAIQDFSEVIKLDPQKTYAYYNRGRNYYYMGKFNDAIQDYNMAIKLNPKYAIAYFGRAISYVSLNKNRNAAEDFNMFLLLNGNKDGSAAMVRRQIRDLGYTPKY